MSGGGSGAVSEAVARIEAELGAFWAAPDDATGATAPKVRAATMNYVVLAAREDLDAFRQTSEALAETHGGRTLLLTVSGRIAPWALEHDVHAVCRLDGAVPVCYDRVDLTFGAVAASRAASVVRSLALPELPTLVEVGANAAAPLIDTVAARFDRLIVDSSRTDARTISRWISGNSCAVGDRAMVRQQSWRELVARFFDEASDALSAIRRVEIARTTGAIDAASLLIGWLASRLGWSFEARDRARDRRGGAVEIQLQDDARADVGASQLTAVRLTTEHGGAPLMLAAERLESGRAARWSMRGAWNVDRELPLGFRDETWVLTKLVDSVAEPVVRESLLAAAAWESLK